MKFCKAHTTLYKANDYPELPDIPEKLGATLTVNSRSFQTAIKFHPFQKGLYVAALYGVDILVTGVFSCGAFKNNSELVAEAWK